MANLPHDPDTPPLKNNRKKKSTTEANDSPREDHREGTKTHVSRRRSGRKTANSCFPPPSLCSSSEGVPCDFSDPSLRLTERDRCSAPSPPAAIPHQCSDGSVPLAPISPSFRYYGRRGGGGGYIKERLPVGSRQFQAIALCSLGLCKYTQAQTEADDY